METIILWIVIIAVGAVWERIKKKADKDDQWQPPGTSPLPAPCDAPWAHPELTTPAKASRPAPQRTAPTPASEKPKPAPLPHAYKPIQNTASDTVMEIETLDDDNNPITAESKMSAQDLEARQAHYDRWRKAILDTQILERKF